MKIQTFLAAILCTTFGLLTAIQSDAKGPTSCPALESEVNAPIAWGAKHQTINVFAWQTPDMAWRYGALEGAHHPFPTAAALEETAHCFETVEALVAALPKDGRLIMMPSTQHKIPAPIRAQILHTLSDAKLLFMGGC